MFWVRPGAYPRVEHLKDIGFSGKHKACIKGFPGANTYLLDTFVSYKKIRSLVLYWFGLKMP